jgi:inner membrane protein
MDTLTHALSGALLARLLATRQTHPPAAASNARPLLWQLVVTGAVAGAFPDIDGFTQLMGDRIYLTQHRGYTHALPLLPLWAWLLSRLLAWGFARTRGRAGAWKRYFGIAAGGIAIHIAGDWITQFGTMLALPFSDHRFGLGSTFIIDLGLSATLVGGLVLAAIWPRRRWPAALGLAAACAWVGVGWVGQQEALQIGERLALARGITNPRIEVMPRPASPFNWTVSVFDGADYHVAHVNTRRTQPLQAGPDDFFFRRFSAPYQPEALAKWERVSRFGPPATPDWVTTAWGHPEFAFFRWFAQTPALISHAAGVDAQGRPERCAWFRDLRFDFPGRDEGPFRYGVCLSGDGDAPARVHRLSQGKRSPV